ncbi:MAG: HEAT repeat domain-containing protein [Gemmatimonadetes bacterium]|nr:HEAT repeat domain-containing protein [Gemmatimonadota bacterium]
MIRALGTMGDASAPTLARLLDSPDRDVRAAVVAALAGQNSAPAQCPCLAPALSPKGEAGAARRVTTRAPAPVPSPHMLKITPPPSPDSPCSSSRHLCVRRRDGGGIAATRGHAASMAATVPWSTRSRHPVSSPPSPAPHPPPHHGRARIALCPARPPGRGLRTCCRSRLGMGEIRG